MEEIPVDSGAFAEASSMPEATEGGFASAEQTGAWAFHNLKTSLPGLDLFDPTVFDMRIVLGVLLIFGTLSYAAFKLYMTKVVAGDDFISDLGISYTGFELPDEIEEYYEKKEQATNLKDLRNPLLKRAIADIPIILRMQQEGPGMNNMYQQAMIGDKEWQAFQLAEMQISEEIEQVQAEANEIEPNWGATIWGLASELRRALLQRHHQMQMEAQRARQEAEEAEEGEEEEEEEDETDDAPDAEVD